MTAAVSYRQAENSERGSTMLVITAEQRDDHAFVRVDGDIDSDSVDEFGSLLMDLISDRPTRLVLDAEGLRYIFSNGLGVLISAVTQLSQWGGRLEIQNAPERLRAILAVTKLDTLLPVAESTQCCAA